MKIIPLIACVILITGCYTKENNKKEIVQGSGTWYYEWQEEKLEQCKMEVAVLAIQIFEARQKEGIVMTEDEFKKLNSFLSSSCLNYYNVSI